MIENESHFAALPVDLSDASSECGHEVVHFVEQDVGQDGSFEMPPQSLDQIGMSFEPSVDGLGVMKTAIVADQPDLAACVGIQTEVEPVN